MPIYLKRSNGEITPIVNAEFIPAFFFIPKSILDKCGRELNSLPRNPKRLVWDKNAVKVVESDLFMLAIIDAYAYMVWTFMGLKCGREIYSGYEPSWRFAHAPQYWIKGLQDEGVLPTAERFIKNCDPNKRFGFVSEAEIESVLTWLVPKVMEQYNMNAIIATAKEYRCFEDFDYRRSNQKIDFCRQWYHTRSPHAQISLEAMQEDYAEAHDGQEWDIADESIDIEGDTVAKVDVEKFLSTLSDKDKQMLELRMLGYTYADIAKKVGYKNHSGVIKRIKSIGKTYEKYTGTDLGFE